MHGKGALPLVRMSTIFSISCFEKHNFSFSIGAFLTNYDITNRKQYKPLIISIGAKKKFESRNKSMKTNLMKTT